jgi:hypothetical protein
VKLKYRCAKITYGRCCLDENKCECGAERAKHPHKLKNLHPDYIRSAVYSGPNISLFARKFKPQVEDGGLWKWWVRLWKLSETPSDQERRNEMIRMAKFCNMAAMVRGGGRNSERMQEELATYLSLERDEPQDTAPALAMTLPPANSAGKYALSLACTYLIWRCAPTRLAACACVLLVLKRLCAYATRV